MVYDMFSSSRVGRTPPPQPRPLGHLAALGVAVTLAALTVLTWWGWLGQDNTFQRTPQGGWSGPYEAPQVMACAVTFLLLAGLGSLFFESSIVVLITAVSFTAAWSVHASSQDRTGLWAVGAAGIAFGTWLGAVVAVGVATFTRRVWAAYR